MSQQDILFFKLVVLIPSCLIVGLFLSKLQVYVTRLEIRGTLPPTQGTSPCDCFSMLEPGAIIFSKKDEEYQQKFPVKMLSRVLEVSVNGYYAWKRRPASICACVEKEQGK